MSFINVQDFIDFGGKNIICNQVYPGITKSDQIGYNTVLPPALGGGASGPGGSNGQIQFNNGPGIFGGYTNAQLTALINAFTATTSGVVPASGGGTSNFIRADGTWTPTMGAPGGANGQVQYNASGNLGGLTNAQLTALINVFSSSLSGAAPASGGGTTNFLNANGGWTAPVGGGPPQRSATTPSTAQPQANDIIINLNLSSPTTITLPPASSRAGRRLMFVDAGLKAGTNNITIMPTPFDTIVNWIPTSGIILSTNGQTVTLNPFNDGVDAGWFIA